MNLTPSEIASILNLSKLEGVSYADISRHKSGNIHIDVCSEENAAWSDIDSAIAEIFPNRVYVKEPKLYHRGDGTVADIYTIDIGAAKIGLHMVRGTKRASAPTEAVREISHSDCITDREIEL